MSDETRTDDHGFGIDSEPAPGGPGCGARVALLASLGTLVGIWALAYYLWPDLPAKIPVHFDGEGAPDRWAAPTFLNWFGLPLVSTFLTAFMVAISLAARGMARRWPGIMNMPRKKDFLRLPPEARVRAMGPMDALLWVWPAPLNGAFTYMVWGSYCVAMGKWKTVPMWPLFAGVGCVLLVTVWGVLALKGAVIRELSAAEERGDLAPPESPSPEASSGTPESELPTKEMTDGRNRRLARRGTAFDIGKGSALQGDGLRLPSPEELRPRSLDDFYGNERAVDQIRRELATGRFRDGPRNMLLYGPPGTGKTTLATIIAREAGYSVRELNGTSLRDQKAFMAFVLELSGADRRGQSMLVFIDEIHAIAKQRAFNQEDLFLLLERGVVHCASYVGQTFRLREGEVDVTEPTIKFGSRPVFMGATTDPGMLNSAFRRRFPVHIKIEPYRPEDMVTMLARYERISSHVIAEGAKAALAGASRTNPANLLSMLDSCLNRAILSGNVARDTVTLDAATVAEELDSLGVFPDGATRQDLAILEKLSGAPTAKDGRTLGMGLASLAGATGMNETTISEIVEPFLKAKGWIEIANRRKITTEGAARLEAELEWPRGSGG